MRPKKYTFPEWLIKFSAHARKRCRERNIDENDVVNSVAKAIENIKAKVENSESVFIRNKEYSVVVTKNSDSQVDVITVIDKADAAKKLDEKEINTFQNPRL